MVNYRIVKNREFFKLDKDVAIDIIDQVIDEVNGDDYQQNESKTDEHDNKVKHYGHRNTQEETSVIMLPNKEEIIRDLVIKLDLSDGKQLTNYEKADNINKLSDSSIFTHDESYYKTFQTSKARLDDIFVNSLKIS